MERRRGRASSVSLFLLVEEGRSYGFVLFNLFVAALPALEVLKRGKREVAEEEGRETTEGICSSLRVQSRSIRLLS